MSAAAPSLARRPEPWLALALVLATLAVYAPVRGHAFVTYDTPDYILLNPQVQRGLTPGGVVWAFTSIEVANWHPLTWLSHMLDCSLFGLAAGRHHLMSVLLHAVGVLLCFAWLRGATGAAGRSAFVAAVFALHPLHVESVAWVAERKDVLSGLLFFATLIAWGQWTARGGRLRYGLALGTFAAALLAKPMVVTLPFVLLLLDYWPLARSERSWRDRIVEKLPFFALAAASCAVTVVAQVSDGALGDHLSLAVRLAHAVAAYAIYLGQALWPAGLAVLYPHPGAPALRLFALGSLVLAAGSIVALASARRAPVLGVGWLWFVGMLVPVIGLVPIGQHGTADRYMYLPLTGLAIAAAWGAYDLVGKSVQGRRALAALALTLVVGLGVGSRLQLRHWQNTYTLFSRALEVTERNWVAHGLVGVELFNRRETRPALEHLERAVEIRPNFVRNRTNLGAAQIRAGRLDAATENLAEALRLVPDDVDARYYHALLLDRRGQRAEAIDAYRELLAAEPDHKLARRRLRTLTR